MIILPTDLERVADAVEQRRAANIFWL